jgi:uncharacterized protein YbaR (Trm112 family)
MFSILKDITMEKKPSIKIPFGLHKGELIHISQIKEENLHGLACDCVCPYCKTPLQARISKDEKRRAHFSHSSEGCSSQKAYETAIHLFAKKIISQKKKLLFPAIIQNEDEIPQIVQIKDQYYNLLNSSSTNNNIELKPEKTINLDSVEIEKTVDDVKPDLVVHDGNNICFIEIAVTHFIDEVKLDKLKKLNYPVIEIDLSNLQNNNLELSNLEYEIIDNPENRKWVHYPKLDQAIERAVEKYQKEKICNTTNPSVKKRTQYIEDYRAELERLRNDEMVNQNLKCLKFYKELSDKKLPFYLDIPISGEIHINCDRRIWQSIIFDKFIYNRTSDELSFRRIEHWLKNYNKVFNINWMKDVATSGNARGFYNAIKAYLRYLSFLGFISPIYEVAKKSYHTFEATVWNSHSLNVLERFEERAVVLANAIKTVNKGNVNPDALIGREIYKRLKVSLGEYTTSNSPCDQFLS